MLRDSVESSAYALARRTIEISGLAQPVELTARFTRTDRPGPATLLVEVYVLAQDSTSLSLEDLTERLRGDIQAEIASKHPDVLVLVDVTVLHP